MGSSVPCRDNHSLGWGPGLYKRKKHQQSTFIDFSFLLSSGCNTTLPQVFVSIYCVPIMDSKLKLHGKVNLSLPQCLWKVILTKLPRRTITIVKCLGIGSGREKMVYVFWTPNNRYKAHLILPLLTILYFKEEKHNNLTQFCVSTDLFHSLTLPSTRSKTTIPRVLSQ